MASLEEISTLKNRGCQENTLRTKRQILTTVIGMSWWTNCYVKLHTVDLRMSWWTNCFVKLHGSEDVMVVIMDKSQDSDLPIFVG